MPVIDPDSTCVLCCEPLGRPFVTTWGEPFAGDPRHSAYYDAPLHLDCLAAWADREAFSRAYFVRRLFDHWSGGGTILRAAPDWFMACGPAAPGENPVFAVVHVADWPLELFSGWGRWSEYVDGGFRANLVGPALDAAVAVMARVRREAPSLEALVALRAERSKEHVERRSLVEFGDYLSTLWGEAAYRIDWQTLEQKRQAAEQTWAMRKRARQAAVARSNEIAHRLAVELAGGGRIACPHCHQRTREMRFHDLAPRDKSYFVCSLCGRSFAGSEALEER